MKIYGRFSGKTLVSFLPKYGFYLFFAVIVVTFGLLSPKFLTFDNIIGILLQSTSVGIAVVGMAFVIITSGIDLSVGSTIFLSATACGYLIGKGAGVFPVILVSITCGAIMGCVNGLAVTVFKITPFIATLATMTACRGMTLVFSRAKAQYLTGDIQNLIMKSTIADIPVIVICMLLIFIFGDIVLKKTSFGRQLYAIGHNDTAARNIGINVTAIKFTAYVTAGITAGIAGLISSVRVGAVMPALGLRQEFIVISCAVLGGVSLFGGKGHILPGALIGVLIISCIEDGLVLLNANPYFYTVIRGFVIYLSVMIDSIQNKGELR
jgi:ribose/xylose/arabinose/galactoside ABC-type transport system permease subunit